MKAIKAMRYCTIILIIGYFDCKHRRADSTWYGLVGGGTAKFRCDQAE